MSTEQKQTSGSSSEQPNDDAGLDGKVDRSLLGRLRAGLRAFCEFFEEPELPPGSFYMTPGVLEGPEVLRIVMPTNWRPEKLVIRGDWGDSSPEVILERLVQQPIEIQHDESSQNKAEGGPEGTVFQDHQE